MRRAQLLRPRRAAFSTRPARSISASTASAAAVASGLPPKVVPCWPAVKRSLGRRRSVTSAPIGHSPADALGDGDASGSDRRACWNANHVAGAPGAGLDLVEDQQGAVALR